jgi:hypothetical protein
MEAVSGVSHYSSTEGFILLMLFVRAVCLCVGI